MTEGQVIGFATEFFTLWDYRTEGVYEQDSYGNYRLVRNKTNYFYVKNISTDLEKVKSLYPTLSIDDGLRGQVRSFTYENYNQDLCPELIKFGTYRGQTIYDIVKGDLGYAMWLVNNCYNWRTKWLLMQIPEVYNKCQEVVKEKTDKLNSWEILDGEVELTFTNNPNHTLGESIYGDYSDYKVGLESYNRYYVLGANVNGDSTNQLKLLVKEVKSVGGMYPYNMAIINGKAVKTKNKTFKVNIKALVHHKFAHECIQYAELIDNQ